MGLCQDRVVVITGAGRGLGRAYALAFADAGAMVVVNDLGTSMEGTGHDDTVARNVASEILCMGGKAVSNADDISEPQGAAAVVDTAISTFGRLDVLVNNAGILRVRRFLDTTPFEFDAIMRANLRGTFLCTRSAAEYWSAEHQANHPVDARVINITSTAGVFPSSDVCAYATAKAAVATFTTLAAHELALFGVTVNAVAPSAETRMMQDVKRQLDPPANNAPVVVWLGSAASHSVTGKIFAIRGKRVELLEGWKKIAFAERAAERWGPDELDAAMRLLVATAPRGRWWDRPEKVSRA